MARIARLVFPGIPHHVTQRGNRREVVFFTDADRRAYLRWFGEYCAEHRVQVLAYCLMANHVHAVLVPETEDGLEGVFRPLNTRYAMRVNRVKSWKGHVWQGRYFSAALDEAYLRSAVRYVEVNPVRAGLVGKAEDYPWSSAPAHCGLRTDALLVSPTPWLDEPAPGSAWSEWLAVGDNPTEAATLRHNVERALPCGSDAFVSDLERRAGQPLRPRKRGRPFKAGQN